MQEMLTMSTKERQRLQLIGHLKQGKTTVAKVAAALALSERQMYRILGRFQRQGDAGLVHKHRDILRTGDTLRASAARYCTCIKKPTRLWAHIVCRDACPAS